MTWLDALTSSLAEHPLLSRLCLAALELLALSLLLAAVLRWWRCSSPRLVALLWLIVLAKPVVSLALGAPIAAVRIEAPPLAAEVARMRTGLDDPQRRGAHDLAASDLDALSSGDLEATRGTHRPGAQAGAVSVPIWLGMRAIDPERLLVGLWLAGAAGFLARYLRARWRLRRIVAAARPVPSAVAKRHAAIARELGLSRLPLLRATDALDSPALVGLVRPVVLLPRWLIEKGSDAALEWALRHELCHCRWRDPHAIFVRDVVAILFFFHPAAWWAGRRHLEALEQACDRDSLRDPSEATAYAEGLYEILLQLRRERSSLWRSAVLALATRGRMARRIAALLDGRARRPLSPWASAGAALTALVVFALGCAVQRSKAEPAPELDVHEQGQAHAHAREHRTNLFLLGPVRGVPFEKVARAAWAGTAHIGDVWGRDHDVAIYDDLFENPTNPFHRAPGDLVVLQLTLDPSDQVPVKYADLLPLPWSELRARMERGDTVEATGSARDVRVLALSAPSRERLATLVLESHELRDMLGASPADQTAHEQEHAGHHHEHGGPRPPDVFIMGPASNEMFQEVVQNTAKGTFSKTGREHSEAIYDEIFAPTPNHFDRSDGDLMVLLFTLDRPDRLPTKYADLLPRPWTEVESALRRGETVAVTGKARGLEIVVLAAPTVEELSKLIATTTTLAPYRTGDESSAPVGAALPAGARYVVTFDAGDLRTASVGLELGAGSGTLQLSMAEGARHVQGGYSHFLRHVSAKDADGRERSLEPDESGRLRVELETRPITIEYRVALEHDATPWPEGGPDEAPYATAQDAFWTGRALFLAAGLENAEVEFRLPPGWRVSTPWDPLPGRSNTFRVADRSELSESFLLAGTHVELQAKSAGAEVLLAVGRDVEQDGAGLQDAVQKVLDAGRELFGGAPPGRKLLVANLDPRSSSGSLNGGVFGNSISLLSGHAFDQRSRAQWAPFVAHEVVHLWNGGAGLRSSGSDSWFSEGFTEYYAYVLCARLGLIGRDAFLDRVRGASQSYLTKAGSLSLVEAGKPEHNVRELQYDGGFVAAFVLDLRLRRRTQGAHGLDDLMRDLFSRYGSGTPYSLSDVAARAAALAGDDLERFFERHVAGTELLPLEADLAAAGLALEVQVESQTLQREYAIHEVLRIQSLTQTPNGLLVRRSTDAGYHDGDLVTAIDGQSVRAFSDVQRVLSGATPGQTANLTILRDSSEVVLPLALGGRENPPAERRVDVRLKPITAGGSELLDAILGG